MRGYTRFTQEQGDAAAAALIEKFAQITRSMVRTRGGRVLELRGDEVLAVFGSARQALRAAVELQHRFAQEAITDPHLPLSVGMGMDAGEAVPVEGGYRGDTLNLAARLCNLAGPGEVLASEGVVYLGRRVKGLAYVDRGPVSLKGFADPVRVIRVLREEDAAPDTPVIVDGPLGLPGIAARRDVPLPIGVFLGALPSGVLVGREQEWDQIMKSLDTVSKGNGRLLLLSGEPGIGKTRLAQELTLKAQHWGFLIATGRCYEQEQSVPYYPFLEALETILNRCPPDIRADIPLLYPQLARLLPEQVGLLGPVADVGDDQQRLFRAFTGLLEAIALQLPVALLLDDLHWADDASLKLLQHLTRHTRASRVLLLGTYRDVELHRHHPLEAALLDLGREGLVEDVEVKRLEQDGTTALVTEILGEMDDLATLAALIHRRTDGNAFFIQEMLRALMESGDVYRHDGVWEQRALSEMAVPKSVRSVIGQRLARLSDTAQEILREASVLGQTFSFDDLLGLGNMDQQSRPAPRRDRRGWTEDEVDAALLEARAAGLVRETESDGYAFNHALTQQALYAELSTRRKKRLHLAAGKVLERLSERVRARRAAELSWHFLEGDDAEQAVPYALIAGDEAEAVFAHGEAETHFRTAMELAQELHDVTREAEALEKLAGVMTIVARYDEALDYLEQAVRLHRRDGNREPEACAAAQIGHIHVLRGTPDEGIARLQPLVEAFEREQPDPPTYGFSALYAALARLYMNSDRYLEQLQVAERAAHLARQVGDQRLIIGAEVTLSDALWGQGQDDDALRVLENLIPQAEAAGDLDNLGRALSNAAMYYQRRGEFDKDRLYHERALQVAERRGDRGQIVLASMDLSTNAFMSGDWKRSHAYLNRVSDAINALGNNRLSAWLEGAQAWLALREGDMEGAEAYGMEMLDRARGTDDLDDERFAERLLAEHDLLNGDPKGALDRLTPYLQQERWREDAGYMRTLAWAYLVNGRESEAQDAAAGAIARATALKDQPELVEGLIMHGAILAQQGRWEAARQHLDYALSGARRMPFPFGEARALYQYGLMYRRKGDPAQADDALAGALALFVGLGAFKDAELTERAMGDESE